MSRLGSRLRYYFADAVDEWRHSPGVNVLATATLAAVVFVAGMMLVLFSNLESHLERWADDLRVDVYLADGTDEAARTELERRLEAIPGVARVEFVDKAEALRRFRAWFPDLAKVPDALESNPLPESLEVYLAPGAPGREAPGRIAETLAGAPGVEDVRYDRDLLDRLQALLTVARVGGGFVGLLVAAAVVFVVASVLRLAVYARRDEIEIMELVGATPGFIRGPFLVAGALQGFAGSVFALGLVEAARRGTLHYAGSRGAVLVTLFAQSALSIHADVLLVAAGTVVGLVGSFLAVRR